jgi:PucR family transcriptional regulator, purine catabolism regulatory protein
VLDMVRVADNEQYDRQDLPSTVARSPLGDAISMSEVLRVPSLRGAEVLAGASGMGRSVLLVNVMEVPDILPWVRPQEMLLTTGYPLPQEEAGLVRLIHDLADRDLAGIAIKSGRYLDSVPQAVRKAADQRGFPVIELPATAAFDRIINDVVARILNRRADVLKRAEHVLGELVSGVVTGGDLEQICRGLLSRIGDAVLVTTADGRVLAESGAGRFADELDALRDLECFDRSGRFLVEDEPTHISRHGANGMHWLSVGVHGGARDIGRLVLFGRHPMTAEDAHLAEQAAAAAALVITKQQAVQAVESKYQADFLHDILRGRAGTRRDILAHAESLGWDLDRPLLVAVAEANHDREPAEAPRGGEAHHEEEISGEEVRSLQERFATAWANTVRRHDPQAAVVWSSDEVIAVCGIDAQARQDEALALVDGFARAVRGLGGGGRRTFSTGISRTLDDVLRLPEAYEEARKAVEVGRRMDGNQSVRHFDSLGVFRLLSLIPDTHELYAFAAETLGVLATDDKSEYADLRRTLAVLLEHNLNVAETARALHFHYNSLRYRIGKLERMLGPFTRDAQRRFAITLALHALQLADR